MKKLYVVTRRDLRPSQQAVQAVHAAILATEAWSPADNMQVDLDWPSRLGPTVVLYGVCCVHHLRHLRAQMEDHKASPLAFYEPDLGGELTAFAYYGERVRPLEGLQLL